ncbi:sporulation protein [Aurantiacibacter xanthus]|uniref:Sporulation protein n=1 Tax=Aurantiacibacter xanthus TaxID=1784712 RepID=A0A3A1P3R5_9SPHN|nr:SPOR domain-containing protein [Aurantiacibacter xanthus]RIV83284.1 sporulation protein [Aurantiacibacter xanthus]
MALRTKTGTVFTLIAAASLGAGGPLLANVRDGVDAWSRGDYAQAIAQWEGPAAAGDPDALFNLAQAYRLGYGVTSDMVRAEDLYRRAAEAGHVQAADTYGLILFQNGRHQVALPYVEAAARRGDPRAQYLLGIAHFNGDLAERDWVRAYALLTLANAQGLPQAAPAIAEMDQYIPLEQRQQAAALAQQLQAEAERTRAVELARFDFADAPAASAPVPRAIPTTAVSPSVASARAALEQANRATGTDDPAEAGATFAHAPQAVPAPAPAPAPARVAAAPAQTRPAPAPAPSAMTGPWKVQLGAFSVAGNAERMWTSLSRRSELAGAQRLLVPSGRVTRLLAGGYPSRSAAQAACTALKRAGHDCLVTQN